MVEIGEEYVERRNSYGRTATYGARRKIIKILKNGNVRLEGDATQQYRAWNDGTLTATGDSIGTKSSYVRVTAELEERIKQSAELETAKRLIHREADRLVGLVQRGTPEQIIEYAKRLTQ